MNDDEINPSYLSGHWPTGTRPIFLLPVECIWTKISGKKILFHKAGSVVAVDELEEQFQKGMKLSFTKKVNQDWINSGLEIVSKLKEIDEAPFPNPHSLQKWREDFMSWLYPTLQQTNESITFLDLCFFCEQAFFSPSETLKRRFIQYPIEIQEKNLVAASIGVFLAISLGYTHHKFLRELYTAYLFFDAPYSIEVWSNSEKEFFLKLWRGEVNEEELKSKHDLVEEYFSRMKACGEELASEFHYKRIHKYLYWNFEKVNGKGRFYEFSQQELSDLDSLSILVYHFEWLKNGLENSVDQPLLDMMLDKEQYFAFFFISRRLNRLLKSSLSEVKGKDDDYLELTGL